MRLRCKLRMVVCAPGRGPAVGHRLVDGVNNAAKHKENRRDDFWWKREEVLDTEEAWV